MSWYHTPVLLQEVIEGLQVTAGKRFIDATLGGGGHTKKMLEMGAEVLAIDEDMDAIEENKQLVGAHCRIVQGNFRDIETLAAENGWNEIDGVLFDLGVSSHQLDTRSRGFSYRFDEAPLDMRFGDTGKASAYELVNNSSYDELFNIFATFGEEERAGDIAKTILMERKSHPIATVGELKKCIERVVGSGNRDTVGRIFQAIRIAVNSELTALQAGLAGAMKITKVGGRIAVISFHSLEDRIVKRFFLNKNVKVIGKKPLIPGRIEQQENRRSRSAKLRIAERLR
jgi:16S rRNA (cytosine1402-N4)-methyltransferase